MATLVIVAANTSRPLAQVEMPNATSIKYATMRAVEALHGDPYLPGWFLITRDSVLYDGPPLDPDDLAIDWDGRELVIGRSLIDVDEEF